MLPPYRVKPPSVAADTERVGDVGSSQRNLGLSTYVGYSIQADHHAFGCVARGGDAVASVDTQLRLYLYIDVRRPGQPLLRAQVHAECSACNTWQLLFPTTLAPRLLCCGETKRSLAAAAVLRSRVRGGVAQQLGQDPGIVCEQDLQLPFDLPLPALAARRAAAGSARGTGS